MRTLWMMFYMIKQFPRYVIGYFTNEILLALPSYVGNVLFLKYLMQALLEREPIGKMLTILGMTAAFLIVADLYVTWFTNKYKPCVEERIQKEFYTHIRDAVEMYELDVYDNPVFYDEITYINKNICKDSLALLSYVSKMTAGIINIILIIQLFYEIGFGVPLISISAVILSFLVKVPAVRFQNQRKYEVNSIERKHIYFQNCFFVREFFLERKMTSIDSLLYIRYEESIKEQIACEKKFGGKLFLVNSLQELLISNLLMNLILIAYLLYEVLVTRTLRSSDFIATYNAVIVIMNAVMQFVRLWGQISESSYTVNKYQKFVSAVPQEAKSGDQKQDRKTVAKCGERDFEQVNSIEFRNVSFAYPGTDKNVLRNICFFIHAGEKIAIVGKNGSGKTTLLHLLMGLYYPTEGEILINGKMLSREEYPLYRSKFAAFFQGMKPLETTVAENVALDTDVNLERVCKALQKTNCEELFPQAENTMIGVQFDPTGLILSGGECQRLMLAQCFYSNKLMLIMDEPSSALDPVAERDFNQRVSELSRNKLVLFVTHRLSTVHMADYIYVIDEGKICDEGSHEELVKKEGIYRQMWNMQLEKYGSIEAME